MKNDLMKIVETYPLFKKYKSLNRYVSPYKFHNLSFSYICKCKNKETTHELLLKDKHLIEKYVPKSEQVQQTIITLSSNGDTTVDEAKTKELNKQTFPFEDLVLYEGICNLCKNSKIEFALKFTSKITNTDMEYSVQKVGQYPSFTPIKNLETYNFLTEEDQEYYAKAGSCLSNGYGIGAFAYFRRIIENEIKRIINDLIESKVEYFENISVAYEKYKQDHQMEKLITETNDFIPTTLKYNGANPLHILYKQLSGGIHIFDEDVCLDKAEKIELVLSYTINRLNKEKYENKNIQNAFKSLLN